MLYAELKAVMDGEPAEGMLERSESLAVRLANVSVLSGPCIVHVKAVAVTLTIVVPPIDT